MHKICQELKLNKKIRNIDSKILIKDRIEILNKNANYLIVINNIEITKFFILYNNIFCCSRDLFCLIKIVELEQYYYIIETTIIDKVFKSCFLFFVVVFAKSASDLLIDVEILDYLSNA